MNSDTAVGCMLIVVKGLIEAAPIVVYTHSEPSTLNSTSCCFYRNLTEKCFTLYNQLVTVSIETYNSHICGGGGCA